MDCETISDFYNGKSVFVTGATGLLGKLLIEKLLRSCEDVENVYVLIREKNNETPEDRLEKLVRSPVFELLQTKNPEAFKKLKLVCGNISQQNLGISDQMLGELYESVDIVVHAAATVKFDENLNVSLNINFLGTKYVLDFCKKVNKLRAFIHISTLYSHCNRDEVLEEVYPMNCNVSKIIESTSWMNEEVIVEHTSRIIGDWPNTYTYTKALAEHLVVEAGQYFPVAIVRPSIVLSTMAEPVAGWLENANGPTGIVCAASKGACNNFYVHTWRVVDMVPSDIVVNLIICAAWEIGHNRSQNVMIYNCCSGSQNPLKWGDFIYGCLDHVRQYPSKCLFWHPRVYVYSNRFLYNLQSLLRHRITAHLVDGIGKIFNMDISFVAFYDKLWKGSKAVEYFTTHGWNFHNKNVQNLYSKLNEKDRKIFCFDVTTIDWKEYLENYMLGIRRYIFIESPDTLSEARRSFIWTKWIDNVFRISSVIIILKILNFFLKN